jgi:uncharacterized protein
VIVRERRWLWFFAALTLVGALVVLRFVRLDPDIGALLPSAGEGAVLRRYLQAFGGGDPGLVLVRGDDRDAVLARATAIAEGAQASPEVAAVLASGDDLAPRTTGAWLLLATEDERRVLDAFWEPAALQGRLASTRALLLAPGSSAAKATLAADPLRLGEALAQLRAARWPRAAAAGSSLVTADGRARLVVITPRGNAFRSVDATTFSQELTRLAGLGQANGAATTAEVTGGHAVSAASEALVKTDLARSSVLALILATAVFLLLFRSPRVLAAVLPPLLAGTLLTTLVSLFFPRGLSAVAVGFSSVVLGVGADSGVHLYAATLTALREGSSLDEAPAVARRRVGKPVLLAAVSAGGAFLCLSLSSVEALRQLGALAAAGEVVTALYLLALTPILATWLEGRRRQRSATSEEWSLPLAPRWLVTASQTRAMRWTTAVVALGALASVAFGAGPRRDGPMVALRPSGLAPLAVYRDIADAFHTETEAPTVVLVDGPSPEAARARADEIFATLSAHADHVRAVDALGAWSPSTTTLARRCKALAGAASEARRAQLEGALSEAGLSPRGFSKALESIAFSANECPSAGVSPADLAEASRYVRAETNERAVATVSFLPAPGHEGAVRSLLAREFPDASLTGIGTLEPSLASALARDLPRVGAAAALFVTVALFVALRRKSYALIALAVIAGELATVLLAMRAFGVPLHVYDALVLPVLLGVTLDETLFVLRAAEEATTPAEKTEAIRREAPLVATTALTTAAGFVALGICRFEGLRHLGFVGAVGSALGLSFSLLAVPAWQAWARSPAPTAAGDGR